MPIRMPVMVNNRIMFAAVSTQAKGNLLLYYSYFFSFHQKWLDGGAVPLQSYQSGEIPFFIR